MTKDGLYKKVNDFGRKHSSEAHVLVGYLEQFFDSNVCIPKGENCHPYHMELHQWAENPLKDLPVFNEEHGIFYLSILDEYRIKPFEPVWEYQWLVMHHQAYIVSDYGRFMTLEETCDGMIPIEETKRARRSE